MTARTHFFALDDPYSAHLYCGAFREGDCWTALPHGVTCPDCRHRLRVAAEGADGSPAERTAVADPHAP